MLFLVLGLVYLKWWFNMVFAERMVISTGKMESQLSIEGIKESAETKSEKNVTKIY